MFPAENIAQGVAAVMKEVVFFEECGWNDGQGSAKACASPAQVCLRAVEAAVMFCNCFCCTRFCSRDQQR